MVIFKYIAEHLLYKPEHVIYDLFVWETRFAVMNYLIFLVLYMFILTKFFYVVFIMVLSLLLYLKYKFIYIKILSK